MMLARDVPISHLPPLLHMPESDMGFQRVLFFTARWTLLCRKCGERIRRRTTTTRRTATLLFQDLELLFHLHFFFAHVLQRAAQITSAARSTTSRPSPTSRTSRTPPWPSHVSNYYSPTNIGVAMGTLAHGGDTCGS